MRGDTDFMVFVAARWPSLVRESVLLGVAPEEAPDATTEALSRCRRAWGRASREEDVDAFVREELVVAAGRRRRTAEAGRDEAARALLVLAPPTLEKLRHRQSQQNRATLRRAVIVAVPLLLVAGGVSAYLATRSDDHPPGKPRPDTLVDAAVSRQENPAPGVAWYADGQLHLDHAVLAVEGIRDMTRIGNGVVYGDDQGRVVFIDSDGGRRLLGHKDPGVPVAATDENGWAAWVDTGGTTPTLEVKEASTGHEVAAGMADAATKVVAVDGHDIYYTDEAGSTAMVVNGDGSFLFRPLAPPGLLDARSRTKAFQLDGDTIDVQQGYFSTEFQLPGVGAQLSPDGNLVATRLAGDGRISLYDTRSGDALVDGLSEDDDVLAFAPGDGATISYIVAPLGLTPGRELQLRTCDLTTSFCKIDARIPNVSGSPVLAR